MSNFVSRLMQAAPAIRGLLAFEPRIGLDLSGTDLPTTLVIMSCLMDDGVDTARAICSYLEERRSKFDRETIEFLLREYEGNDPQRHLWEQHYFGNFTALNGADRPVYTGGPAWSGDTGHAPN